MGFAKKKTSQCNNTVKNWYYLYWHVDLFSAMIIVLGYLVSHREKTSWLMHPLHQLQPCQKIKACVPCCRDILLHLYPVWPWRDPHKTGTHSPSHCQCQCQCLSFAMSRIRQTRKHIGILIWRN